MADTYRFRHVREMCGDVQGRLQATKLPDEPFVSIVVHTSTKWEKLQELIAATVRTPAAIIVPGNSLYDEQSEGNDRTTGFVVFVVAQEVTGRSGEFYGIADIADAVVQKFTADPDTPAQPVTLHGVEWGVDQSGPIDAHESFDVYRIDLRSWDHRQMRDEQGELA